MVNGSLANVAGAPESSKGPRRPRNRRPAWLADAAEGPDRVPRCIALDGDPATDTRQHGRRNGRQHGQRHGRLRRRPNNGMELTSALPRFARRHGRRSQLMPSVLRT